MEYLFDAQGIQQYSTVQGKPFFDQGNPILKAPVIQHFKENGTPRSNPSITLLQCIMEKSLKVQVIHHFKENETLSSSPSYTTCKGLYFYNI